MTASLIGKYRSKGVLIDANLLIGLLVGRLDPKYLPHCRATKNFTQDDFDRLAFMVSQFDKIITTPHILTEVSNLAGRLPHPLDTEFRTMFGHILQTLSEQSRPAADIGRHEHFVRFGLTDTAISMIAPGSYLVLTVDLALYGFLESRAVDVINFNHIRMSVWQ